MSESVTSAKPKRWRDRVKNRQHQRAFQFRRRQGQAVTRRGIQYTPQVVEMLISEGHLDPIEHDDAAAIWSAINDFVKAAASGRGGWR